VGSCTLSIYLVIMASLINYRRFQMKLKILFQTQKPTTIAIALLFLIVIYQQLLLISYRTKATIDPYSDVEYINGVDGYDYSSLPEISNSLTTTTTTNTNVNDNGDSTSSLPFQPDLEDFYVGELPSDPFEHPQNDGENSESSIHDKSLVLNKAMVTILTGTHLSKRAMEIDEGKQHVSCGKLAESLHLMWAAWDVKAYAKAKQTVKENLKQVAHAGANCILSGSRKHDMIWTFPMSWRPESQCDAKMKTTLETKSYIREKTKIYVNWFLLRPDLVTFYNMASVENIAIRIAASVGADPTTASFSKEGCPRFNTILEKRDIYKQRLLLVALSDIEHQLERIKRTASKVYVCAGSRKTQLIDEEEYASWLGSSQSFSPTTDGCDASHIRLKDVEKTHVGSMLRMRLLQGPNPTPVKKTVFTGPRLIFVAGLEGVGHHVFQLLGKKHTTRSLYDSLTEHLCDSAWDDNSLNLYGPTREKFIQTIKQIKDDKSLAPKDGSNVFFLNTVFTVRDVNMYSYPWGGPRCFLKRYARVMCNIDLVELCRIAEEAGIDFRVVWLKRSIGAAVVSASLHRPFGTLVSETRMLALSWALLKSGVDTVDRRFTMEITYEDMINQPQESTAKLAEHLGFEKANTLYTHFEQTLTQSSIDHPVGDGSRWKEEVDLVQLQFMSDLLGM
jgi:hypothetical protein